MMITALRTWSVSALSAASLALVAALAGAHGALAETPEERTAAATAWIGVLVDKLSTIAADEDLQDAGQSAAFRDTLAATLATGIMGRQVLGPDSREGATDEQLARYEAAFPGYIASAFAREIDLLAERRIDVEGAVLRKGDLDDVVVKSQLFDSEGRAAAPILWRVRYPDGEPRLADVLVKGSSQLTTKRTEVTSFVQHNGLDALLAEMEATLAQAS